MFEEVSGLALLAGFYPPAILIAALYLGSARPGRMTALYVIGGFVTVTIVGTAALIALRAGGLSHHGQQPTRYGLRLALGIVALIAALVLARRKPRTPDPAKPKKPSLIDRMSSAPRARTAFIVGILMFGPSVTFIAAVQVVATAKASVPATVAAMALIIVLTLMFAWIPLVAYLIAPDSTVRGLRAFDGWLRRHGRTVLTGAVGLIGILLVIQGIVGLS
jgi:Sap, sulfolipid-1-addressing protein